MAFRTPLGRFTLPLPALAGCLLNLAGCGGSRFGSDLNVRPKPQPIGKAEQATVCLPEQRPFSIAVPKASREAGLDGTADADATVTGTGTAAVSAAVTHSGTALGSFQLGHAFENDSDQQADFDLTVQFRYVFEAGAAPESGYPDAETGLKLYARDNRGRLLRDLTLVQHSTENGPASGASTESRQFTLTLGPGEAVSVFLAGQVKVEIREGRSAHGSLKLSDVRMELTSRPAPAVRTSGDGQK